MRVFCFISQAKIDELLRREKEREQRVNHIKTNVSHKSDTVMSMSTDIPPSRRATSASRLRSNHQGTIFLFFYLENLCKNLYIHRSNKSTNIK